MISIVQQTPLLAPAYNDLVMTVVSDNVVSKYKFKYVFDIFSANNATTLNDYTYVGRVRVTPNPVGYGMLDLSRYIQNQVESTINYFNTNTLVINNATGTTVNNINTTDFTISEYYVVVGEEYSTTENGPVLLYNGNDTIQSGTTLTSITGNTCYGFDGVKQYNEGLIWDATDYVLPTGRTLLTNSPRTLYKESDEFMVLSVLFGTYSGTPFNVGNVRSDVYDSNNTLLATYPTGGVTGFTRSSTDIEQVYGSFNLNIITSPNPTWNKIIMRFGYSTPFSESITIYRKNCPWDKYDPVDIVWLNRIGGWDTFRFYGSKEETLKIDRTTYKRAYGTWSGPSYTYGTYERGTRNIRTDLTQQGEVMSDFIDINTVNWLGELLTSPQVFIIESGTSVRPINITDNNFKIQLRGNTKLRQVSFKYDYSELIRTQQK